MSELKEIDYLDEDPLLTNQKYVCVSFLTPNQVKTDKKIEVLGLKIRGVYDTFEEAQKRANKIRNFDPAFNVYVGEVGKWLAFNDDPELAKDEDYSNKELNKLMKNYKEQQERAKDYHEERKQTMIDKATVDKKNNLEKQNDLNEAKQIFNEKDEYFEKIMRELNEVNKEIKE